MSRKRNRSKKNAQKKQKQLGFLASLESYTFSRIRNTKIKWEWVGIGLAMAGIGASLGAGYLNNSTLFGSTRDVIELAASKGDYQTARKLWDRHAASDSVNKVLGVNTEVEEMIYPEKKIEREIAEQEELLVKYPNNRDVLIYLSKLYESIGDKEQAANYWEQARILDPNNEMFRSR